MEVSPLLLFCTVTSVNTIYSLIKKRSTQHPFKLPSQLQTQIMTAGMNIAWQMNTVCQKGVITNTFVLW